MSGWEVQTRCWWFPPFLRFDEVRLQYATGSQSLLAKFRLFESCLESIKPALNDSNKICFVADINRNYPRYFSDHSSVVIYLRDRLLPICGSSRRYEFDITLITSPISLRVRYSEFNGNSAAHVISSLLQFPQVRLCSNVSIKLRGYRGYYSTIARLPVEDISNWLTPKNDEGVEIRSKKEGNRFLLIYSGIIPNTREMWDHLMGVNLIMGLD